MTEAPEGETSYFPDQNGAVDAAIDALRRAGADQFDPVRFRYLEALAARLMTQQDNVKRILEAKLTAALASFSQRFEQAQGATMEPVTGMQAESAAGGAIGELLRYLAQHSPEHDCGNQDERAASRPELKTIRHFRNDWAKLSAGKQVSEALEQGPENAGPLNSHLLVLRSLALMREISPDYLKRFMSYADTLLCLDQFDRKRQVSGKKTAGDAPAKKPKARRTQAR